MISPDSPSDMDGSATAHHPAQDWSYRVPSPPQIMVPPAFEEVRSAELKLSLFALTSYPASEYPGLGSLETMSCGKVFEEARSYNWRYEWRRRAQQILPFLYLGPMASAKDKTFLSQEGITMLLAVRTTMSARANLLDGSKVSKDLEISFHSLDVETNSELIKVFSDAFCAINNHLCGEWRRLASMPAVPDSATPLVGLHQPCTGKVLVYCESGNERSAVVVAAYLMAMYDLTVVQAVQLIQSQRFCASFEDSMKHLLSAYQDTLTARRDVLLDMEKSRVFANGQNTSASGVPDLVARKHNKRNLDDINDVEMEEGQEDEHRDQSRFEYRDGSAPFQDRPPL